MRFDDTLRSSEMHAIAKDQSDASLPLVDVTTVDLFCRTRGIGKIDLLKLDTEGNELKVLEGAAGMIAGDRIPSIMVECSLSYGEHAGLIPFRIMQERMDRLGYVCLGIYHQSPHWLDPSTAEIQFANCVFVSRHMGQPSPP